MEAYARAQSVEVQEQDWRLYLRKGDGEGAACEVRSAKARWSCRAMAVTALGL